MRTTVLAALAALAVGGCTTGLSRQDRAVAERILEGRLAAWARFMNNQALDSLAGWYWRDSTLTSAWPDGRRTRGWEEEQAALAELFRRVSTLNLVLQGETVRLLDADAALVTFGYSMDQILRSRMRDIFSGEGTQLWLRQPDDGPWVIAASHLSRAFTGSTAQPLRR